MPSKYVHTEVEGQKVRLSNIDKVIYPNANITKAEIIQYYLSVADEFLKYSRNRPLTLIRFPDGIEGESFYAKAKPHWTPDWVDSFAISHSDEKINYIVPKTKADIAWLANLSALELHPMQFTIDNEEVPDHFIFDLDPPEGADFDVVREIAFLVRDFLNAYDYPTFCKTSGSKGIHIFVPIKRLYTHDEMNQSVKKLANKFVKKYPDIATLHLNKSKRKGRILIDIFRNRKSHTTVAPYSLRGKAGAPISMPIDWQTLREIKSSKHFTIKNYDTYLDQSIHSWKDFYTSAVELHDRKVEGPDLAKLKEEKLKEYYAKRNFDDTPEPKAIATIGTNNRYVIQLHDASNLHYDLRLEEDGTLLSWAIPKGLPLRRGVKRMAIRTEDHPMSYLTFEGVIPKGNYGAGQMWIYERGTFEWIKKSKKKYKIKIAYKDKSCIYYLYNTKGSQWLVELKSEDMPTIDIAKDYQPMLAEAEDKLLTKNYEYEIKWDGIRAIVHLDDDKVTLTSRGKNDLTDKFPELHDITSYLEVEQGIFDGEIVCLDDVGKPIFNKVISRMHTQGEHNIMLKSKSNRAVLYLFDCLMYDGKLITHLPLVTRRAWLKAAFSKQESYRFSKSFEDGAQLLEAVKDIGLEGIMMKDVDGKYHIGSRSKAWLKLKTRHTAEVCIIGYTKGKGDRSKYFGSLHLASRDGDVLAYKGRVGSGFNGEQLDRYHKIFQEYIIKEKPISDKVDQEKATVWMEPILTCTIRYASLTNNGTFREPVFVQLNLPDT